MGSIVGVSIVVLWIAIPLVVAFKIPGELYDKLELADFDESPLRDPLLLRRAYVAFGGWVITGLVGALVGAIGYGAFKLLWLPISTLGFWLSLWVVAIFLACAIPSFLINKYLHRKVRSEEARKKLRPYLEQAKRELEDELGGDTIEKAFAKLEREVART